MVQKTEVSIIIPSYNEESAIVSTVEDIKKTARNAEIIVVNDGSTDSTAEKLKEVKGIKVISHPYNKGYGASLKTGIKAAKNGWILIIDADKTYSPGDIPRLLEHIPEYDMVVGSRTGKQVRVPFLRKPAKLILTAIAQLIAGRKIPDLNSGLRAFRKEIVEQHYSVFPSGFSFTTTLTLVCLTNEYAVKYVPIDYHKREGKSTIHPVRDFFGFMQLIFRTIMHYEPLKIFIPVSMFVFLLTAVNMVRDIAIQGRFGSLSVILFMTGMQILFFGLLADVINKKMR